MAKKPEEINGHTRNAAGRLFKSGLTLLAHSRELFGKEPALAYAHRCEELARVEYDTAYVHYLRGAFAPALHHMDTSAALANAAGDTVGWQISTCVRTYFAMLSVIDDEASYHSAATDFRTLLTGALEVFLDAFQRTRDPNAERWIRNVHAHLFGTAFTLSDVNSARMHLEKLQRDPWNRKYRTPDTLTPYRARYLMLLERYKEAADEFGNLFPLTPRVSSRVLRREEQASHYYYFGEACARAGDKGRARAAFKTGLRCHSEFGNRHWYKRLRTALLAAG